MILRDEKGAMIFAAYIRLYNCNDALESGLHAIMEGLGLAFLYMDCLTNDDRV